MLDPDHIRSQVIRPTLWALGLHSEAAEELLLGTAIQESRLRWLVQLSEGPALGLWQMEPATHNDIWKNFLAYRTTLNRAVRRLLSFEASLKELPAAEEMVWNLRYAVAMARVHYYRVPLPLPPAGNLRLQAQYWKTWYNTPLGAGTVAEYIENSKFLGGPNYALV